MLFNSLKAVLDSLNRFRMIGSKHTGPEPLLLGPPRRLGLEDLILKVLGEELRDWSHLVVRQGLVQGIGLKLAQCGNIRAADSCIGLRLPNVF